MMREEEEEEEGIGKEGGGGGGEWEVGSGKGRRDEYGDEVG